LRTKICKTIRGCSFAFGSTLFHSDSSSLRTPNASAISSRLSPSRAR